MPDGSFPRETVASRIARLQAEAKALAKEQIDDVLRQMEDTRRACLEVSTGGDAYPAGVRDLMRRVADDLETRVGAAMAITGRIS